MFHVTKLSWLFPPTFFFYHTCWTPHLSSFLSKNFCFAILLYFIISKKYLPWCDFKHKALFCKCETRSRPSLYTPTRRIANILLNFWQVLPSQRGLFYSPSRVSSVMKSYIFLNAAGNFKLKGNDMHNHCADKNATLAMGLFFKTLTNSERRLTTLTPIVFIPREKESGVLYQTGMARTLSCY